jgi:hypothetical protein
MKNIHLILVATLIPVVASVLVFCSFKAVSQKKITQTTNAIPDNVVQILRNSCTACHNTGGNEMAMSMWNFSSWDTYAAAKKSKKATAMCDAITKGKMPPASVKKASPDKIPTAAQIEMVCKWATSLNLK